MIGTSLWWSALVTQALAYDLLPSDPEFDAPQHPFTYEIPVMDGIDSSPVLTPQVVGGSRVEPGRWQDTVGIVFYGAYVGCTGTLVGPKVVVTAAHCIRGSEVSHVLVGSTNWLSDEGEMIEVEAAYGNRGYQGWGSDIAVLKLSKKSSFEPRMIASDCLIDEHLIKGAEVAIVGFGNTNPEGGDGTSRLFEGVTTVRDPGCSRDEIEGMWTGCDPSISPGGEVVAGGDGVDACYGDSGGPLYLLTDEGDFLIGVTSRSLAGVPEDAPCKYGGIWTRPDYFLDWIEEVSRTDLPRPQCNARPVVQGEVLVAGKNQPGSITVAVDDPDGETHTITVAEPPAHGTVEIDGDVVTYVPDGTFVGKDPFKLAVTDDGSAYEASPPITVLLDVDARVRAVSLACGGVPGLPGGLGLLAVAALAVMRRRTR